MHFLNFSRRLKFHPPSQFWHFHAQKGFFQAYLLHILFKAILLRLKESFRITLGLLPSMGEGGNEPVGEYAYFLGFLPSNLLYTLLARFMMYIWMNQFWFSQKQFSLLFYDDDNVGYWWFVVGVKE